DGQELIEPPQNLETRMVQKGGRLRATVPMNLLVEAGGRAEVTSFVMVGILKRDAELNAKLGVRELIAEEGAKVVLGSRGPKIATAPPVITFCRLPKPVREE